MSRTETAGSPVTLSVSASGTGPFTYQWQKDGVALPGATLPTYSLSSIQVSDAGDYTVEISNAVGTVTSRLARLTTAAQVPSRLINMSVRSLAGSPATPLIVGFVTSGGYRDMVIRAVGPTLGDFGVSGVLNDPSLSVHVPISTLDTVIATNDNWYDNDLGATLSAAFTNVGAFPFPANSKDAAVITAVDGDETIHVTSMVPGETGVVLVEAFDAGSGGPGHLINLSARNHVGVGSDVLIVGFVINGNAPKKILVRGVGPGIAAAPFNVPDTLANPVIELHTRINGVDTKIATNDDWGDEPGAGDSFATVGAFALPAGSADAAIVMTLPSGSYTAICHDAGSGTGEAIIEAYEIP